MRHLCDQRRNSSKSLVCFLQYYHSSPRFENGVDTSLSGPRDDLEHCRLYACPLLIFYVSFGLRASLQRRTASSNLLQDQGMTRMMVRTFDDSWSQKYELVAGVQARAQTNKLSINNISFRPPHLHSILVATTPQPSIELRKVVNSIENHHETID